MIAPVIPHSRPWITLADQRAVAAVLASGMIAQGTTVDAFESAVGRYLGVSQAVALSSGGAALVLALRTLQVRPGDEVILPTYICRSVLEAVLEVGAVPVLCDVDQSGVITAATVELHISSRTRAIIAAHVFGHPCDVQALRQWQIPVIDDACQAFGLKCEGGMAATLGDVGVLSFHATKCLTTGEGGMLVTRDKELGARARELMEGRRVPVGRYAARLSDLQAALGLAQLERYSLFVERRETLRRLYAEAATQLGLEIGAIRGSNFLFRFTLRSERSFEALQAQFLSCGVGVRRGVDELLHRVLGLADVAFPSAVRLYQRTLSVPLYPALSDEDAATVRNALRFLKDDS